MTRIADLVRPTFDIESEDVPIAKWGVTIRIKSLNGTNRAKYLQRLIAAAEEEDTEALAQLDAELVVASAFDPEDDSPAFLTSDIPWLMEKSGEIIGALSAKAQRLSGLDGKAEERLGKDSSTSEPTASPDPVATPSDASSSDSPES